MQNKFHNQSTELILRKRPKKKRINNSWQATSQLLPPCFSFSFSSPLSHSFTLNFCKSFIPSALFDCLPHCKCPSILPETFHPSSPPLSLSLSSCASHSSGCIHSPLCFFLLPFSLPLLIGLFLFLFLSLRATEHLPLRHARHTWREEYASSQSSPNNSIDGSVALSPTRFYYFHSTFCALFCFSLGAIIASIYQQSSLSCKVSSHRLSHHPPPPPPPSQLLSLSFNSLTQSSEKRV